MLNDHDIGFRYRDYKEQPLTEAELRKVLKLLKLEPRDVLRTRDRAFKDEGLSGDESAGTLIRLSSS